MKHRGILLVVSGFSGAGKGTIVNALLNSYDNYALSVSMTTRSPRIGEENGKDYFFVTKEQFENTIEKEGFIEHACYCDHYYGTPRDYVEKQLDQGKDVILEIEIQGAMEVKKKFPSAVLLFVTPPSAKILKERLTARGTETTQEIEKRLKRAYEESDGIEKYDYIVINDDLNQCVNELHNIVTVAHNAPNRNEEFIKLIRDELKSFSEGE